jgi:hypothetical protein
LVVAVAEGQWQSKPGIVLGNGRNVAVVQLSKARTIQVPDVAVQFSGYGCKNASLHSGL